MTRASRNVLLLFEGGGSPMVQRRYTGIPDPRAAFEALRPFDAALLKMMQQVKPWGPEYMILDAVRKTLATAAYHFTRDPEFYAGKPHG